MSGEKSGAMDDLTGKLNQVLSDPAAMEQVGALAKMLGLQQEASPPKPIPPQPQNNSFGNLAGLLGGLGGGNGMDPAMLQTVSRLMPLLQSMQQEDDSTRLLHSLRPLLGPERQRRLDEVSKLLRLFRLLPMLKGQGLF